MGGRSEIRRGERNCVTRTKKCIDDGRPVCREPTRENILLSLSWLVTGAADSSSLFFYFSGHGKQMEDFGGEGT